MWKILREICWRQRLLTPLNIQYLSVADGGQIFKCKPDSTVHSLVLTDIEGLYFG